MNAETKQRITLSPVARSPQQPEPFWLIEATYLIRKIHYQSVFELRSDLDYEDDFLARVAAYRTFEEEVMEAGTQILTDYPDLTSLVPYLINGPESRDFDDLHALACLLHYQDRGQLDNAQQLKRAYFASLFLDNDSTSEATTAYEDLQTFYTHYRKEDIPADKLLAILDLHSRFDHYLPQIRELLTRLAQIIEAAFPPLRDLLPSFDVNQVINDINQLIYDKEHAFAFEAHAIYPCLLSPKSIAFAAYNVGYPFIMVGIFTHELYLMDQASPSPSVKDKASILKAMGDPVRYQILKLSKDRPVYLTELANKLDLKPSTISHHLNTLIDQELLVLDVLDTESRKIYYKLNPQVIRTLIQGLDELL